MNRMVYFHRGGWLGRSQEGKVREKVYSNWRGRQERAAICADTPLFGTDHMCSFLQQIRSSYTVPRIEVLTLLSQ